MDRFTASLNNAPATELERAQPITLRCPKGYAFNLTLAEALTLGHDLVGLAKMAEQRRQEGVAMMHPDTQPDAEDLEAAAVEMADKAARRAKGAA